MSDEVKPLTYDEIIVLLSKLPKDKQPELNKIYNKAANSITSLVVMMTKKCTEDDELNELERLKRLLSACAPDEIFMRIKDKVWAARKPLREKDVEFFLKRDYSSLVKKDHNQLFIEHLMIIVRDRYMDSTKAEQDMYFRKGWDLVDSVEQFKKLINE